MLFIRILPVLKPHFSNLYILNLCRPGMTAGEELWGQFYTGDRDRDLAWDAGEWTQYVNNNNTEQRKSDKMR